MRQAGRYMSEYRAVRKQYSLIEICKRPEIAAGVTITAAEALGVDAAIIFADLLLPLEVIGPAVSLFPGEGPVIEKPFAREEKTSRACVPIAPPIWVRIRSAGPASIFGDRLPVIGFCGAPFTLASYMIEGGSSRNYLHTKRMIIRRLARGTNCWRSWLRSSPNTPWSIVRAGADALQIFDSWVGCLSVEDYCRYVLPRTDRTG